MSDTQQAGGGDAGAVTTQAVDSMDISQRTDVSKAAQERRWHLGRTVPHRDRLGADLGDAVQHPDRGRLRRGQGRSRGVPVRDDRPGRVQHRLRGHGQEEDHSRRLLLLHQPGPGPRDRHRHRIRRGAGLLGLRGVACAAASPTSSTSSSPNSAFNISWPWLALAMVVIISVLTYFDVRLSSIILGVGLIAEIVMLLIFDGFMFAHGHIPAGRDQPGRTRSRAPARRASWPAARSASGCSSPSGPGSGSRWRRTTARSPRTRRGTCRGRCTSR